MNFCFYYCPIVFGVIVHTSTPQMGEALNLFRSAMLFYMRGSSMVSTREEFEALRGKAATEMWTFATIMERIAPPGMMTVNLRFLAVHLHRYAACLPLHFREITSLLISSRFCHVANIYCPSFYSCA